MDGKPVVAIGDSAFERCFSLLSVTLPESLQTIGNLAFFGCSSLCSVSLPGDDAFADSSSDLTLRGAAGSYAEKYARENGIRFEAR
ncbi:MAG: leucine-rich repeat protein [Thermoguttaceae bacterium]|nr:leucine-rich repeat protein [Thermoguttaceae bacterium]MBQ6829458.1 leucine-rich repeat protein [Thermoguttaceae bacterium]MBQ7029418.1 leucine-rich repeat protein [Thermoguttaceae bacterium]MBQ7110474.1 leucine-rich repeat protein [Thermoguttaceae bacterium]